MNDNIVAVILACGENDGLGPLTVDRTKAAIPFGGEYRIVDFVLSNCLHSGLRRMLVLTEAKSYSLQAHLRDGWNIFNTVLGQYVMPVGPQMVNGSHRYWGSADAIAQNQNRIEATAAEHVLVANGEHVYRMDYEALATAHEASGNDVTVVCIEFALGQVGKRVFLGVGDDRRVNAVTTEASDVANAKGKVLAPMGVTLFKRAALFDALDLASQADRLADLYLDVLPVLVERFGVGAYQFGGAAGRVSQDRYWTDVANVDDYFQAHMGLLEPVPSIDLYQPDWQIWSYPGKNPPARTVSSARGNEGIFVNSIVSNGTVIEGGAVSRSVLCPRVSVADSVTVERSVLLSGVTVGAGSELRNCIIDKRVSIPAGTRIGFDLAHDAARFNISAKGVAVVSEGHTHWD